MKPKVLSASRQKAELEYMKSIEQLSSAKRHHKQKLDAFQAQERSFWGELKRPSKEEGTPTKLVDSLCDADRIERLYLVQDKLRVAAKHCQKQEINLRTRAAEVAKNKTRFEAIETLLKKALTERKRKAAENSADEVAELPSHHNSEEPTSQEEGLLSRAALNTNRPRIQMGGEQWSVNHSTNHISETKAATVGPKPVGDIQVSCIEQGVTDKSITVQSTKPGLQGMSVRVSKSAGGQVRVNVGVGKVIASPQALSELIAHRLKTAYSSLKDVTIEVGSEVPPYVDLQASTQRHNFKRGRGELYDEY